MHPRLRQLAIWSTFVASLCLAILVRITAAPQASIVEPPPLPKVDTAVKPVAGPNVLLITIDALRADHTSLYHYERDTTPAIAAFFDQATIFDHAYATAPNTNPSVVSMLTGLYPPRHGVRLLCQRIENAVPTLAGHLGEAGYQTAAVVSNAVLANSASGLGSRFDYYDDHVDEPEEHRSRIFERNAARTTDAAIEWLSRHRDPERPHFLWVHYIDPHGPYNPPPDAPARYTHAVPLPAAIDRIPKYVREPGITDALAYVDRYDEEIRYTDLHVGRLLDAYRRLGVARDAVVILTADHGEYMMGRKRWFGHGYHIYNDALRIPLALHASRAPIARVEMPVSNVDIVPTVLELVGIRPPDGLDGESLLQPKADRTIYAEGRGKRYGLWRVSIRGDVKLAIRAYGTDRVREQMWFNLATDPGEQNPLRVAEDHPLRKALMQRIANDPDRDGIPADADRGELPAPGVAKVDPDMLEKLKALGYVNE